jgi:hypothetical protein
MADELDVLPNSVEYPEGTVVALDQDPNVQSVEKDHVVTTQ